jgi:hypothetical protein
MFAIIVQCFSGTLEKLQKATISFVMSVRLSTWKKCGPHWKDSIKFYIWAFFEEKKNCLENPTFFKIRPA